MLQVLQTFRDRLDGIMLRCMHASVLLYGYESYTGRFIKWYAEYYHSIKIDYLVSTDMSRGRAYDQEIFRPSILDFNYKDVRRAVIWVTEPVTPELERDLAARGYEKGVTWFDFFAAVYGDDIYAPEDAAADIYTKRKSGRRDIQFLEWLEYKFGCNFVTRIKPEDIPGQPAHNSGYGCTTQKEIFPMLDRCHVCPQGGGQHLRLRLRHGRRARLVPRLRLPARRRRRVRRAHLCRRAGEYGAPAPRWPRRAPPG